MTKYLGLRIILALCTLCGLFSFTTTNNAYAAPVKNNVNVSTASGTKSSNSSTNHANSSNSSNSSTSKTSSSYSCKRPPVSTLLPDGRTRITDGCSGGEITVKAPSDYTTPTSGNTSGTRCTRITTAAGGYDFCGHTDENGKTTYDPVGTLHTNADAAAVANANNATKNDDESSDDNEKCHKEAGTMGWIICPIIYGMGEATKGLYEFVEPHLRVEDSILKDFTSQDGGSYSAWSIFRDFANVLFVIVFLIVIISQVTGVGVSNYGIKKILPRLIVTAILVNLSFILCRIAVDVSNIVGSSINDLFTSIASTEQLQMEIDATAATPAATIGVIVEALLAILGIVGGFAAVVSAVSAQGWALIIPILLTFVVILAGVALAAIVLAVRQALVIIMTVLSPVAIVLYLLPNTSNVTTRWLKLFEGILLTYPICGLLIGGGNLASHIILHANSGEFFLLLTGAIVCVAPYFFIPSLIMKSVNGFGNIGAKIMAGRQAVKGGVGKLKQSEGYQRGMTNARAFSFRPGKRGSVVGKMPVLGAMNRRASAGAIAAQQKQAAADRQAAALLYDQANPNETAESIIGSEMNEKTTGKKLFTMLDNASYKDGAGRAGDKLAEFIAKNGGTLSDTQRQDLRSYLHQNSDFNNSLKARNADLFNMITDTKKKGKTLQDYSKNAEDLSNMPLADWSTQSTGMLDRTSKAGGLTAEKALAIQQSDDKAIQSGMMSDKSKADIINRTAAGATTSASTATTTAATTTTSSTANTTAGTTSTSPSQTATININNSGKANYGYKAGSGRHMPEGGASSNRIDIQH